MPPQHALLSPSLITPSLPHPLCLLPTPLYHTHIATYPLQAGFLFSTPDDDRHPVIKAISSAICGFRHFVGAFCAFILGGAVRLTPRVPTVNSNPHPASRASCILPCHSYLVACLCVANYGMAWHSPLIHLAHCCLSWCSSPFCFFLLAFSCPPSTNPTLPLPSSALFGHPCILFLSLPLTPSSLFPLSH